MHWCLLTHTFKTASYFSGHLLNRSDVPGSWVALTRIPSVAIDTLSCSDLRHDLQNTTKPGVEAALNAAPKAWAGGHPDNRGHCFRALLLSERPRPLFKPCGLLTMIPIQVSPRLHQPRHPSSPAVMALRIRNVPAVIEWSDISATPRLPMYLAEPHPQSVQLSLHFDQQQQATSFKIRILLNTRKERAGKDGDYLHILVNPSDVILLLQDPTHLLPDDVSDVLRGPTTCLRLVLRKPLSIAAPSDISLPEERNSQLLSSLSLLAKQTVLTVHFGQHHVSSPEVLRQLCQAYCNGSVKQHPRHNTLQDFYPGRGAIIIEDFDCFTGLKSKPPVFGSHGPGDAQSTKIPPPYAEAQPPAAQLPEAEPPAQPPPSLFARQSPMKRRRTSTSIGTTPLNAHNFYTEFLAQQKKQTEAFLFQQAQMGKMLAHLGNQVEQMPDQIMTWADKRLSEEMAKRREKEEEAIQSIIQQEVEVATIACLEKERENFQHSIKEDVVDDLKSILENGLFTISLPSLP